MILLCFPLSPALELVSFSPFCFWCFLLFLALILASLLVVHSHSFIRIFTTTAKPQLFVRFKIIWMRWRTPWSKILVWKEKQKQRIGGKWGTEKEEQKRKKRRRAGERERKRERRGIFATTVVKQESRETQEGTKRNWDRLKDKDEKWVEDRRKEEQANRRRRERKRKISHYCIFHSACQNKFGKRDGKRDARSKWRERDQNTLSSFLCLFSSSILFSRAPFHPSNFAFLFSFFSFSCFLFFPRSSPLLSSFLSSFLSISPFSSPLLFSFSVCSSSLIQSSSPASLPLHFVFLVFPLLVPFCLLFSALRFSCLPLPLPLGQVASWIMAINSICLCNSLRTWRMKALLFGRLLLPHIDMHGGKKSNFISFSLFFFVYVAILSVSLCVFINYERKRLREDGGREEGRKRKAGTSGRIEPHFYSLWDWLPLLALCVSCFIVCSLLVLWISLFSLLLASVSFLIFSLLFVFGFVFYWFAVLRFSSIFSCCSYVMGLVCRRVDPFSSEYNIRIFYFFLSFHSCCSAFCSSTISFVPVDFLLSCLTAFAFLSYHFPVFHHWRLRPRGCLSSLCFLCGFFRLFPFCFLAPSLSIALPVLQLF